MTDDFLRLSQALTGVPKRKLAALEGDIRPLVQGDLDGLLNDYKAALVDNGVDDAGAAAAVLAGAHGDLARSIIKLWLLGSWWPADSDYPQSLTTKTFIGGLVWRVMQAHPTGYTSVSFEGNNRFGYWENAPPPLEGFLGDGEAKTEG